MGCYWDLLSLSSCELPSEYTAGIIVETCEHRDTAYKAKAEFVQFFILPHSLSSLRYIAKLFFRFA